MDLNYVGLEIHELSVLNEFVAHLPSPILSMIDGYFCDLENASANDQIEIVKKLICCLRTQKPQSFQEYIGYVAFAAAISLIKHPKVLMDKCALLSHVFDSSECIVHWNSDLIKISIIAQTIWKVCASRLDNVRRIATIISCKNNFTFVTSILLISAAMKAITYDEDQPSAEVFCMHNLSELLQILIEINSIENSTKRLYKLNQFFATYSLYQSIVYLEKPKYDVNPLLTPYFTPSMHDLLELQQFLQSLCIELNILVRKQQCADCLAVIGLIEVTILPGLEQIIENVS